MKIVKGFGLFSIAYSVQFAVSIYVIQAGVRMLVAELTAFKGVADKFIPNAVPALLIQFVGVFVEGTAFGGSDAAVVGMLISQLGGTVGSMIFMVICIIFFRRRLCGSLCQPY